MISASTPTSPPSTTWSRPPRRPSRAGSPSREPLTLGFLGIGQVASAASKKNDGDKTKLHKTLDAIAEALAGFTFGLGLTVSGMRRAAKVSGFLSATRASFDPSLMLVMGGAMALSIPGFAIASKTKTPACTGEFSIPKNRKIDDKLMLGGVLFGAGWGLAGMCPGPAIEHGGEADAEAGGVDRLRTRRYVDPEVHSLMVNARDDAATAVCK